MLQLGYSNNLNFHCCKAFFTERVADTTDICENLPMGKHEHLIAAGIERGQSIQFPLISLIDGRFQQRDCEASVQHIAGGGFHGSVIILNEAVIKTTSPPDRLHELFRYINWDRPFPSQASETAAQLDFLAGSIIHTVIPRVTEDRIRTPQAIGYTRFPSLGYGQVIERVKDGRIPTFIDGGAENEQIRKAREALWNVGVAMGFEHAAQIHPDNPFGKPNLWIGNDGKVIWLDYLPAFRHTTKVKPIWNFPFHDQVRAAFETTEPTFNKIHTDKLRRYIAQHPDLFADMDTAEQTTLNEHIQLYDQLYASHEQWLEQDEKSLFIQDWQDRGIITAEQAQILSDSPEAYTKFSNDYTRALVLQTFAELVDKTPAHILWNKKKTLKNIWKFFTNAKYRYEHTLLWGAKTMFDEGIISQEEYDSALEFIPKKQLLTYDFLATAYVVISRSSDYIIPVVGGAVAVHDPIAAATVTPLLYTFAPGTIRALLTEGTGIVTRQNLHALARKSFVPMAGTYLAVPLELREQYGENGGVLLHYTGRSLVGKSSHLFADGGIGSDREERWWTAIKNPRKTAQTIARNTGEKISTLFQRIT